MPFSWNKINTCNNTSHIFPCVDSTTIAWTIRACQQCGSCKRLQVFFHRFPHWNLLRIRPLTCHRDSGIAQSAKSLTSGLLSLYTSYSNNLFPHLFASKKGQQHVIVHSSAHVSHPPILVSSGSVSWQICHHMSPFTHAEIDTLESAGEIPIHHTEAVEWSDCAGSARRHPMAGE